MDTQVQCEINQNSIIELNLHNEVARRGFSRYTPYVTYDPYAGIILLMQKRPMYFLGVQDLILYFKYIRKKKADERTRFKARKLEIINTASKLKMP